MELAAEQQAIGAEYVGALVAPPVPRPLRSSPGAVVPVLLQQAPAQHEVERALADYEQYVTNRASELEGVGGGT